MPTETRSDHSASFMFTKTLTLGAVGAVASVDSVITDANIKANDDIIIIPPATMSAGVVIQCVHTVIDGGCTIRTTNASAGSISVPSLVYKFIVFRK